MIGFESFFFFNNLSHIYLTNGLKLTGEVSKNEKSWLEKRIYRSVMGSTHHRAGNWYYYVPSVASLD
jgi:hypothetical protein